MKDEVIVRLAKLYTAPHKAWHVEFIRSSGEILQDADFKGSYDDPEKLKKLYDSIGAVSNIG